MAAEERIIRACFLNIVATPHPQGVYARLLRSAAGHIVGFWGSYRAAISEPQVYSDDKALLHGQLFVWVEVDPDQPAINKQQLQKTVFPDAGRQFTREFGVNGRVFDFVFDTSNHILTTAIRNDEGQTITPNRLERIFQNLLSPEVLGVKAELVEVTVLPREDALSYVLGFERLDRVEILVKIPNQDDITDEANRVMQRLRDMKAKSELSALVRAPKTDGLELDEEHMTLARVAAANGHVDSKGVDSGGASGERSTRERPKIVERVVAKGISYLAAIRGLASEIRNREKP
ncbi:MAG: hypothetical protein QOH04_2428 [Sphingomonadales bacterium]|jgi:hypothetical protein|nr:hypothetical protein [Sphingomonadales bacterium]